MRIALGVACCMVSGDVFGARAIRPAYSLLRENEIGVSSRTRAFARTSGIH